MQDKKDINADDYHIDYDAPPHQEAEKILDDKDVDDSVVQQQQQSSWQTTTATSRHDHDPYIDLSRGFWMILGRTFALVVRHAYQLHSAALTVLLPTLFVAMFALILGDTLFQTSYAANDDDANPDLPYSLEEHIRAASTLSPSDINIDATQSPTMDNTNATTLVPTTFAVNTTTDTNATTTALSLAAEWREQLPWILMDTVLFGAAAVLVQAVLVRLVASWHAQTTMEAKHCNNNDEDKEEEADNNVVAQQQQTFHFTMKNDNDDDDQEEEEEEEDANLHVLRHVLWHSLRLKLLWQTALFVQGPLFAIALGGALLIILVVVTPLLLLVSQQSWIIRMAVAIVVLTPALAAWMTALVRLGIFPALLILVPIVVLEPAVTNVSEAWQRARTLTTATTAANNTNPRLVTTTSLVVAAWAAGWAVLVSVTVIRSLEGAARLLAAHQGVYLRTNEEEWEWCLLVGILACLLGPILIAAPWVVVHQTVLYLHLRANHTPEGYTVAELQQDLEQTRGVLIPNEDESKEEDVWCDEPAATTSTGTAVPTTTNTTVNVEMTTYARITHLLRVSAELDDETYGVSTEGPLRVPSQVV